MQTLFLMLSRAIARSQMNNHAASKQHGNKEKKSLVAELAQKVEQLQRENHSIRARLSAVQTQIQEISQVNEILLYVQQQIMSSMGAMTEAEMQTILSSGVSNDDEAPN